MKRVAIPITENRLSEYFGQCSHYEVVEIGKKVTKSYRVQLPDELTFSGLPLWLEKQGITDVIAHKVDREIVLLFAAHKVNLFLGIPLDIPAKLIDDYLSGRLQSDQNIIIELTRNEK